MNPRMDAEKGFHKVIGPQTFEELKVRAGDPRQDLLGRAGALGNTVARESRSAAIKQKHLTVVARTAQKRKKHVLVIPFEKDQLLRCPLPPFDDKGDDALGVGAAVHIVPQKNQPIRGLQRKRLKKTGEFLCATMNISDDVDRHVRLILSYSTLQCKPLSGNTMTDSHSPPLLGALPRSATPPPSR